MSEKQFVTVDVRKLGLGMSHAFQGMAEVCASLGVPQDSMLGAVDEGERMMANAQTDSAAQAVQDNPAAAQATQNASTPASSRKASAGKRGAKQNADQARRSDVDVAADTNDGGASGGNAADADASVKAAGRGASKSTATADDIIRILSAKVQQKKIVAADARALLEKYGAKSMSALDPQYYDAVLEEASSM